jgi:hypothetical protein
VAYLYYGAEATPAWFPDRVLAHVKVVAATKLRRGESFLLNWRPSVDPAQGFTTIWMQPSIPLRFVFDSPEPDALDPAYLRELANAANSGRGIVLEWDEAELRSAPAALEPVAA